MSRRESTRAKNWCFTTFDIENEPLSAHKDKIQYIICGRERCPRTNRQHIQGFVVFKSRTRFSSIRNWLPGAHIEKCHGSVEDNIQYCKKDGEYTEYGIVPKISGSTNKFKDAINLAERGAVSEIKSLYPGLYLRYKNTLESLVLCDSDELVNSCGVWICGPPRCGKDYAVKQLKDLFVKPLNKWWDGYKGESNVLISDVDENHSKWIGSFLKIWCDRYPFIGEIKCSSIKIRPKRIYVTSNYTLETLFSGQILLALNDRFDVYDCFGNEVVVTRRKPSVAPKRVLTALCNNDDVFLSSLKGLDETDSVSVDNVASWSAFGSEAEANVWSEEDFA